MQRMRGFLGQPTLRLVYCNPDEDSRLGYQAGWRFLASPRSTLSFHTQIALITMNPGGSVEHPDHGRASSEPGSAYVKESWRGCPPGEAPLQKQVRGLFSRLQTAQGIPAPEDDLLHKSIAAYFVPFRSPTFQALAHRAEALDFASKLWARVFKDIDPRLIITIDQGTTEGLTRILCAKLGTAPVKQRFPTGWGKYTGWGIIRFPHLSRFGIFGRLESAPYTKRIVEAATTFL